MSSAPAYGRHFGHVLMHLLEKQRPIALESKPLLHYQPASSAWLPDGLAGRGTATVTAFCDHVTPECLEERALDAAASYSSTMPCPGTARFGLAHHGAT